MFDVASHASDMARVLRVCDLQLKACIKNADHHAEKERRNNSLRQWVLPRLIRIQRSPDLILNPLTLEGLSIAVGISDRFSAETWTKWLLLLIMRQMNKMSLRESQAAS